MREERADRVAVSRARWNGGRRVEARQRAELVLRVERGELTAAQANDEASLFKREDDYGPLDLKGFLEQLDRVRFASTCRARRR
ncbi:MAG: hypothetical protein HS113_15500 [Verrucomicrobiales bacterium]|nr:hypothetical protein [Verrucomicrobiales bacterium]